MNESNDVFIARGPVLIAGATINGSTVDIAVDETGTIAARQPGCWLRSSHHLKKA